MPSVSYIGTEQENGPESASNLRVFLLLVVPSSCRASRPCRPGPASAGQQGLSGGLSYPGVGLLMAGRARRH